MSRLPTRAAWALWATSLVLVALMFTFYVLGLEIPLENRDRPPLAFIPVMALMVLAFATVGALVASRRPGNAVGWIFCGVAIASAVGFAGQFWAEHALVAEGGAVSGGAIGAWLSTWTIAPALTGLIFFALLFPDGRLLSPRWRLVAWLALAGGLAAALGLALDPGHVDTRNYPGAVNPVGIESADGVLEALLRGGTVASLVALGLAVAAAIRRFRRSTGVERQQLKWVVFAGALAATAFIVTLPINRSPWDDVAFTIAFLALVAVPVSAGVAILRYRLYDVDLVINRTLVYGSVTALLAGAYFGLVLLFQLAFRPVTEGSGLAVALSTLAVAALFRPARSRIQAVVDRRFYRQKYDAQQTLTGFASRLRDEVDLDALRAELTGVVGETMQPAHVSLWLKEGAR
jgi:hypothetical protein